MRARLIRRRRTMRRRAACVSWPLLLEPALLGCRPGPAGVIIGMPIWRAPQARGRCILAGLSESREAPMTVTRRSLLGSMAKLGGAGAVAETLAVWDFLKPAPALAASLALPKDSGVGKTVAILGAGVSGLCAAYELDRAGYDVVILEAQRRAGGRSLTLRRGGVFQEMNQPAQICEFDHRLYLNAGPGRLPPTPVNAIDYCPPFR